MKLRGLLVVSTSFIVPLLLFFLIKMNDSVDELLKLPNGHFYIVSSVAILAFGFAVAVGISGIRLRNMNITFLSLAFISLAEIFTVHGLSTPDFLIHTTHLPGFTAQLSVLLASIWLCLSSMSTNHRIIAFLSHQKMWLLPAWTLILGIFGAVMMAFPNAVEFIPYNSAPLVQLLTGITTLLNAITMYRYYRTYRYSRFPLQIAIVYSAGWLIASQVIIVTGETWRISWWLYHLLLLGSMIVMIVGLFRQYASSRSMTGALRSLFTNDPVERVTSSLSPSVKALVLATETKDSYTAGHNFRVTMYALRIAQELEVPPELLRAVAQGTIVHDVGKINIPDQILNKPGKLTPEERLIIETHPVKGYDMCRRLGFMKEELDIIRYHHERWDGAGYPDGLAGERIPLVARIVAVADVYDALTSSRSYRKAWSHEQTVDYLLEQRGTHFDPVCVDAWVSVCERDPSIYSLPDTTMAIVG